jgi:ABC-type transport system substrate-binding protein
MACSRGDGGAWLAALLLLVAVPPAAAQAPRSGGTLRAALRAEVSTFDVHKGASGSDHMYLYPVFDTLVRFDDKMSPRPGLAESWETPDPKTLVLKLRKGVKFHDGTPFNAEAVRFNLARAQDRQTSSMASELTSIEQVEVVDPHTVRLRLKAPDASLILAFADRAGMMISPTAVQKLGDQFGRRRWGRAIPDGALAPGSEVRMDASPTTSRGARTSTPSCSGSSRTPTPASPRSAAARWTSSWRCPPRTSRR